MFKYYWVRRLAFWFAPIWVKQRCGVVPVWDRVEGFGLVCKRCRLVDKNDRVWGCFFLDETLKVEGFGPIHGLSKAN